VHKATIVLLSIGTFGFLVSAGAIYTGIGQQQEVWEREADELGKDFWTGKTPATFEGELSFTSFYPVFIEETRDADVTLVGGDEESRFVPCIENNWCGKGFTEGSVDYRLLGIVQVMETDEWKVRFSGDVTGGSEVVIREAEIMGGGVTVIAMGCFGSVASCMAIFVGVLLAFTLKGDKGGTNRVVYTPQSVS
jgi:hypothetical protein